MQEREQKLSPLGIEITNNPTGVMLEGVRRNKVPHADLIQATMNASAIVLFGLGVNFSAEGGAEGMYKGYQLN